MNIIYALYCPETYKPKYVGLSKVGLSRPFTHIKEKSHSNLVNDWVHSLTTKDLQPILVILENEIPADILSSKERYWISKLLKEGNPLLNKEYNRPKSTNNIKSVRFPIDEYIKMKEKVTEMNTNISVYLRTLIEKDLENSN